MASGAGWAKNLWNPLTPPHHYQVRSDETLAGTLEDGEPQEMAEHISPTVTSPCTPLRSGARNVEGQTTPMIVVLERMTRDPPESPVVS